MLSTSRKTGGSPQPHQIEQHLLTGRHVQRAVVLETLRLQ
jgi:hypothetical protein